ncbi:MAG: hypothetical protein QM723_28945 [Myxococcaceae bacterium]
MNNEARIGSPEDPRRDSSQTGRQLISGHEPPPAQHPPGPPQLFAAVSGSWTTVNTSFNASQMMLLTDGRILVQNENATDWYFLTPDAKGNYATGTFTAASPMSKARLYYCSAVLKDGRVAVLGGEYTGAAGQTEDGTAEIYDPVSNSWSAMTTPGWANIGDAPCEVMPDGRLLLGSIMDSKTAIWDPVANSWSDSGSKQNASDEESWVLQPGGEVVTVDCARSKESEIFVPGQGWHEGGALPVEVVETSSQEIGPAFLLADGRSIWLGATGHSVIFTPTGAGAGTWAQGPDFPQDGTGLAVAKDAPGVMLTNGHLLITGSSLGSSGWGGPTKFYDFDTTTNPFTVTQITAPNNNAQAPYEGRMMVAPSGEILYAQGTTAISFLPAQTVTLPAPTITSSPAQANAGTTIVLSGTLFNGISQGVGYGDDAWAATNYPLVRLTATNGNVYYARTFNHSTMAVATGSQVVSTNAAIPSSVPNGSYQLRVIANGVPSAPVSITIGSVSCMGCVDANGACAAGNTQSACGAGGNVCAACGANQSCTNGACVTNACNGCVDSNGSCQSGTANIACGNGGNACVACGANQTCTNGSCVTNTCNGCVNANGSCQSGTSNSACGNGGNACVACGANQTCTNGSCVTNACNGCVDANGSCQSGSANTACGNSGNACVACGANQTCTNGSCVTNVCNGCVDANGTCVGGTANNACGAGGSVCTSCGTNQSCVNHACQNNATCAHGLCSTGTKLTSTCDSCAASICAADSYCCNTSWDSICVGEVSSVCHLNTCQASCTGCVGSNGSCQAGTTTTACGTGGNACVACGSGQTCQAGVCKTATSTCAHSECTTGAKLSKTCDPCVTQICAVDSYCCSTSWDSICKGEVKSVCNQTCN